MYGLVVRARADCRPRFTTTTTYSKRAIPVATLDAWRPFLVVPRTLTFPQLVLKGQDNARPLLVGNGEVRLPSLTRFEFTITGKPENEGYVFAELMRQQANPYDSLARFRLIGTDVEGTRWALGWTIPNFSIDVDQLWTFCGDLQSLSPDDTRSTVSDESNTELVFVMPLHHPMTRAMVRYLKKADGQTGYFHTLNALGSEIRFTYEPDANVLSIVASHSPDLRPTYTENWLSEPLRILFGQPIYPRLIARNLGAGKSIIYIGPSPNLITTARWAALWQADDARVDKDRFWLLYKDLLAFIARGRDEQDRPNFEANKVTRLFEEIIQASAGSRWVWALTFASSIEGLTQILIRKSRKRLDVSKADINGLAEHVNAWHGPDFLKRAAVNAVHRMAEVTTIHALRELKTAGVISEEQLSAWQEIRGSVMHGNLVSPYSTEEDDGKLVALAAMMHALTREVIRRSG